MQEYRDNWRRESPEPSLGGLLPGVRLLVVPSVVVYLGAFFLVWSGRLGAREVYDAIGLDPRLAVFPGHRAWQLVSYAFVHDLANPFHLVVTLYMVWVAGRALEPAHGTLRFVQLYMAGVLAGAGAWSLATLAGGEAPAAPLVGGSVGAVTLLTVYLLENPDENVPLFLLFDVRAWAGAIFMVAVDIVFLVKMEARPALLAIAHVSGVALGLVWVRAGRLLASHARPAKRLRPDDTEPDLAALGDAKDALEEELDRVLRKVHEEGISALTPGEKAVLDRASRHYRERK